jgi:hypothetical protein
LAELRSRSSKRTGDVIVQLNGIETAALADVRVQWSVTGRFPRKVIVPEKLVNLVL